MYGYVGGAGFIEAPLTVQNVGGAKCRSLSGGRASLFSLRQASLRRGRCPPRWRCNAQSEKAVSFAELEAEIREYLDSREDPGSNPLAYTNLGEAGRTDLISRIMEHGGYLEVSRRLEIPVDESDFIPPPPIRDLNKSLFRSEDDSPSLLLGRDLEARLGAVEQVIEDSKAAENSLASSEGRRRASRQEVPTGEELRLANEQLVPPVVDEPVPEGELFALTASMRLGMLVLAAVTAVGFGRASPGVISQETITTFRSMAGALGVAHLLVSVYAGGVLAAQYNRNRFLWSVKVLLSGPIGLKYLRSLGSL